MTAKTVLIADPNPATQQRVHEAFEGTGCLVLRASGVDEALEISAERAVDLIFAAVRLPGGRTGYELARTLRDQHPAALVYLLAGGFDVYDAAKAEEAGVDGRISVPFAPHSLRARVEQTVGPFDTVAPQGPIEASVEPLPSLAPPEPAVGPPPVSDERLATFLPRDFRQFDPVSVDPAVIAPAMERAIMEVLPEVVEAILRNALVTSPTFKDMVDRAVAKAVAERTSEEGA